MKTPHSSARSSTSAAPCPPSLGAAAGEASSPPLPPTPSPSSNPRPPLLQVRLVGS
uniref:Uncharacterized protein n=1 Tax=Arundo donax TaxID=35708 RepID=A0A0A9C6V0_ARUDO